jgi:hypothetical protein
MKKLFTFIALVVATLTANAQTWNFKVYSSADGFAESFAADKTALDAAVTAGTWTLVGDKEGRYQAAYKTVNEELKAGDTVLQITRGLYVTGASGKFRVDAANNQFGFNGKDLSLRIRGLKAGQKLQFVSRSASNSSLDRYFEATQNLEVVEGFNVPEEGNPEKTNTATVKAEGDVVITSMVGGLNVLSITVFDVDGTQMTKDQVIAQGESYVAPREMTGTIVRESKTWICPQDLEKDTEMSADNEGVTDFNGLFLRGKTGSHAIKIVDEAAEGVLAGEAISVVKVFGYSGNSNLAPAPDASADVAIKNATDMSIALNAGVAGKLYVLLRPSTLTEGRYVWIYKNGEKAFEKQATDWKTKDVDGTAKSDYDVVELENDATGATYFIGGSLPMRVAAVKFVVAGSGETTVVGPFVQRDEAEGQWYNLRGQAVTTPSKGIFVKNGKKYFFK